MARFDHIQKVTPGDTKTAVTLDMRGFVPSAGRSGHLDAPGPYEFEIKASAWTEKKSGGKSPGDRNFQFQSVSIGPEGYDGVPLVRRQPAPHDADPKRTGEDMLRQIVWAIAAHDGKLEAYCGPNAKPWKISPEWFVGKKFYATVKDGEGEFAGSSEIDRYVGPDEFKAALTMAASGAGGSKPQRQTPDVGTKNGNGSRKTGSAPSAVDELVGAALGGGDSAEPEAPADEAGDAPPA